MTRILHKGNFLDPGDVVEPGVPQALHPFPAGAPTNRLGLARWLVDPENPLTARVAVNRFWAQIFGVGLVETEEDFGTQGEPPSHPELLDWLAVQYRESGWNTKSLLRLIVTSATYRQSSKVTPELLEKDPRNRLLARAPRVRLEAEMVRDQALALSGLLSRKVGGPSVFPPQPDGLWQAAFNGERTWSTSQGEDRYRRGLYTFWRRTVPYPSMATFDAPSREICAIRRVRTNTPLQSFVTLNDPVYVEAAQALARRIVREGGYERRSPRPLRLAALPVPAAAARAGRAARRPLHSRIRAIPQGPRGRRGPGHRPARAAAAGHGPGRAGRLDHGRQRALESRRRLDQRLIPMDLDLPWKLQLARAQTRRQFLKTLADRAGRHRPGAAPGPRGPAPASASRAAGRRPAEPARVRRQPDGAPAAALRAQGQERHLSAHVGRAAAAGPVRLQARAGQAPHAALPRRAAQEPEVRVHQGAPQAARHALQVREMRPERRGRERALAAACAASSTTSPSSSRCTPTSSTMRRRSCSSTPARRATAGPRWARGSPTGWARRTRTCPASSS